MLDVTTTDASGARVIAELIHGHGVSHVFFVPAILRDGLAELGSLGVRAVSAHGEKAAAYMADGYARALGRPGICMSQTVGAANIAAGLKDAYLSCSDVIAQAFRVATSGAPGPVHVELRGHTGQLAVGTSDADRPFALSVDRRFGEVPPFRPVAAATPIREALQALA